VVIKSAVAVTFSVKPLVATIGVDAWSVALSTNVEEPEALGVPLIRPVGESVSPAGREPLTSANVMVPVPPVVVSCAL
jgi:hypothetical protein